MWQTDIAPWSKLYNIVQWCTMYNTYLQLVHVHGWLWFWHGTESLFCFAIGFWLENRVWRPKDAVLQVYQSMGEFPNPSNNDHFWQVNANSRAFPFQNKPIYVIILIQEETCKKDNDEASQVVGGQVRKTRARNGEQCQNQRTTRILIAWYFGD